jgi:hypothetical protein
MQKRRSCLASALACFAMATVLLTAELAYAGDFFLKPIGATGPHTINGNQIILEGGGQQVTFELRVDDWDVEPDVGVCSNGDNCSVSQQNCAQGACQQGDGTIAVYQARLDGSSFVEGLAPVELPPNELINIDNPEYVFFGLGTSIAAVDTSSNSYAYGAVLLVTPNSPPYEGVDKYGGTLVVDVPVGTIGSFPITFNNASTDTFMLDPNSVPVAPIITTAGIITIACQGNSDCDDSNACTTDVCLPDQTCANTPNFDDVNFCCNPTDGVLTVIDDGNECTVGECNPADGTVTQNPQPFGTVCGNPAMGECDAQDTCDLFGACVDRFATTGTACGDPSDSECDGADSCDGLGACQDNLQPFGAACGDPSITDCDRADTCDGLGACLVNIEPSGTACGDPADTECDNPDTCDGAGACLDNVAPSGLPCGNPVGNQCDNPDTCDGAGTCAGNFVPAGTACGNPADTECDNPDTCDGMGICDANRLDDGTACTDDGNQCRDDVCLTGVCSHPLSAAGTPCGDPTDTDCNGADSCDGAGTCLPNLVPSGDGCGSPDDTACTDPDTCNGFGTCQPNNEADGTDCDDGSFCNAGAECLGGTCGGGSALDCDDGLTCTDDSCNEQEQQCDNILIAGNCLIGGACFADGELNPDNDCQICDPVATTSDWTLRAEGTACSDGDVCTGPDTCDAAGTCVGVLDPACNDDCINAVQVFDGSNVSNNDNRGPDDAEAGCQPASNNDVWFFYVASCDGPVQVDTIGSTFTPSNDSVLSVYEACGGPEIACDDDAGPGLLSLTSFAATAGNSYFIRIAGFMDNSGDIVLNITTMTSCVIGGVCLAEGTINLENECEACIPMADSVGWSPRPAGSACGDSGFGECDSPDSCDGAGSCEVNHKPDGTSCSDDGNDCTGDVCDTGVCVHPNLKSGTACGDDTANECDQPDTCDGGGTCLSNFVPTGVLCGDPSTSECDNADVCDGAGSCDANNQPDGLACSDDGNDCTEDECSSGICVHPFSTAGSACGDAGDSDCDNPDTCDGSGICLPNFESVGFSCGDPADTECDNPDTCNGAGSCLVNFEAGGVACGDPTDTDCDNPDTCDGIGSCGNNLELSGFPCGNPSNTQCDNPDTCDGAGICLDNNEPVGLACGDPTDTECDNPDSCDGLGGCLDNNEADGLACADDANDCTDDFCSGGVCAHPDEPAGTACGSPIDSECDNPDTCDGSGTCLDNFEPLGASCGAPNQTQCDLADSCDGAGICDPNLEDNGVACDDEDLCTGDDVCADGVCEGVAVAQAPIVTNYGPRALQVTPLPMGAPGPVALNVTSPDWTCLDVYVAADGSLTTTPVFQLTDDWGTVIVQDEEVVPESLYEIRAECGAFTSDSGSDMTSVWADVDGNGEATLADVQLLVLGFQGTFIEPLETLDIWPCVPNGIINFEDIQQGVLAFQGWSYVDTGCPLPCN